MLLGELVGDIGKSCRTLVGSHYEIGIVAIASDHIGRRNDFASEIVIGKIQ